MLVSVSVVAVSSPADDDSESERDESLVSSSATSVLSSFVSNGVGRDVPQVRQVYSLRSPRVKTVCVVVCVCVRERERERE